MMDFDAKQFVIDWYNKEYSRQGHNTTMVFPAPEAIGLCEAARADGKVDGFREGVEACEFMLREKAMRCCGSDICKNVLMVSADDCRALLHGPGSTRVDYDASTVDPTPTDVPHLIPFSCRVDDYRDDNFSAGDIPGPDGYSCPQVADALKKAQERDASIKVASVRMLPGPGSKPFDKTCECPTCGQKWAHGRKVFLDSEIAWPYKPEPVDRCDGTTELGKEGE